MEQKYQDKLSDDIKFPKIKGSYQTPHPVHQLTWRCEYPHAVHLPQEQRQPHLANTWRTTHRPCTFPSVHC